MSGTPFGLESVFFRAKPLLSVPVVTLTVYDPAVPFAVNTAAVASPVDPVVAVVMAVPVSVNVPLAPLAGAVNVTTAPCT